MRESMFTHSLDIINNFHPQALAKGNRNQSITCPADTNQPPHLHSLTPRCPRNMALPYLCQCCSSQPCSMLDRVIPLESKKVHENGVTPFSTTIIDATTHPSPCISTFIVNNATMLKLQKLR